MYIFICPVCGSALEKGERAYTCKNGHSFDIAAQGYVNLMPSDKPHGNAGDSAEMMAARSRFLSAGYYSCLKDAVAKGVAEALRGGKREDNPLVIDAGCGEGYYTAAVEQHLGDNGIRARVAGIDISKRGIKYAAKRDKAVAFAVAGIFNMPFATAGADVIISIFAPLCDDEFRRVLAPGGTLFVVGPGKNHLFGLKEKVYDTPYLNDEEEYCPQGFEVVKRTRVYDEITVLGGHIHDLFLMTPYFWNTPQELAKRLDGLERLDTPVDFIITQLKRQ